MNIKSLLFSAAVACGFSAQAQTWQTDSITMGQGYAQDVYYSLQNGTVKTESNTNWHMAFQMTPQGQYGNAAVWANHVQGKVEVYSLHLQASTHFASLSSGDTVGKTHPSLALRNDKQSWNKGAFNQLNKSGSPFDYGWGFYDLNTHNLNGDSLFLIKINGAAYKVWIQEYISTPLAAINWKMRVARFDGAGDTTVTINRNPAFTNRLFAYYDVVNSEIRDREPGRYDWDLLFTRYTDSASMGSIFIAHSPVAGVFSNFGVSVAEVHDVNPDTANYQHYTFGTELNAIGYDWKHHIPQGNIWVIDSTLFFVKTKNTNEYYKLQFLGVDGSATGKVVFRKKLIGPTQIATMPRAAVAAFALAPNPAADAVQLMVDARQASSARVLITDISGRVVHQGAVQLQPGMNAFGFRTAQLPAGTYMVSLTDGNWKLSNKLVVAH